MCKESSAFLPIPVFVCVFSGMAAQSISTEHALKRYLFHNEFDPTSRPVDRNNDIVVVYLDLAIHQIVDLVSYCVSYIFFVFLVIHIILIYSVHLFSKKGMLTAKGFDTVQYLQLYLENGKSSWPTDSI